MTKYYLAMLSVAGIFGTFTGSLPAFASEDIKIVLRNEDQLSTGQKSSLPSFLEKIKSDLKSLNKSMGSVSTDATVILNFSGGLEVSGNNSEQRLVLVGSRDSLKPENYGRFISVLAHEWAHSSFADHLESKVMQKTQMDSYDLHPMLLPFNELYADLASVLYTNDPKLLHEILKDGLHRSSNPISIPVRDFTTHPNFKGWQHEFDEMVDKYLKLDPVRGALWPLFIKNISEEDKETLLKVYLSAVEKLIVPRILGGMYTLRSTSAEQLNKDFLRLLIDEARTTHLPIKGRLTCNRVLL